MSAPGSPTGTAPVHPHLAAMGLTPPVGVDVAYEELLAEVLRTGARGSANEVLHAHETDIHLGS